MRDKRADDRGPVEVDGSTEASVRDQQTVNASGERLEPTIEGVLLNTPAVHVDHRGRVFEFYSGPSAFWAEPIVFGHVSSVRPNAFKGWGLHFYKDDRYTLISGEILVVLWDSRMDSSTRGVVQRVFLSPDMNRQVLIPAGVWHAMINLSSVEAFVINMPTQPYDHANPDKVRLARTSPVVPVDLADFFPGQFDILREHPC
jgi:dTDP-4-dehydrorhamnose 3,5-epimerase